MPLRNLLALSALLLGAAATAGALSAGGPAEFDLTWNTIDCGGGTSSGADFQLSGTIGQHDAGTMSGGSFTLTGGYWSGAGSVQPVTCTGDLNNDAVVNVSDLLILLGEWGPCGKVACAADLNGDDVVNVSDLLLLLGAWGACDTQM